MGKHRDNLTDREVKALRKNPGKHWVSASPYLQVKKSGAASWLFRFMLNSEVDAGTGKRRGGHWMGLGSYQAFTLAEARLRARDARQLHTDKIDPLEARRRKDLAERLEAAKTLTFDECAGQYVASHAAAWKNGKHAGQWRTTFQGSARAGAATKDIQRPAGQPDRHRAGAEDPGADLERDPGDRVARPATLRAGHRLGHGARLS
jgi:Arm DNA-binding domain